MTIKREAYVDWTCPKEGCRIPGQFDDWGHLVNAGAKREFTCTRCGTRQIVTLTEDDVVYMTPTGCSRSLASLPTKINDISGEIR